MPDVPTIDESGVRGFEASSWNGLLAPSGTAAPIIRTLHQETVKALAQPDVRGKLAELGMEGVGNTPEEFAAVIKATSASTTPSTQNAASLPMINSWARSGVERSCSSVPVSHSRAMVSEVRSAAMIIRMTEIKPGTM